MRIALFSTAPSIPSIAGARAAALLPYLREGAEVELFVAPGTEASAHGTRSARELDPQRFDQIVHVIGNERSRAFMAPVLRAVGGTAVLDEWCLGELAFAARPALESGGARGIWAAWLEGGLLEARRYAAGARSGLVLNRSIVRHADAFLVPDAELARRIRIERNAPTPVGVVAPDDLAPAETARRWLEHLAAFPAPRVRRKSLLRSMIEASDKARAQQRSESG